MDPLSTLQLHNSSRPMFAAEMEFAIFSGHRPDGISKGLQEFTHRRLIVHGVDFYQKKGRRQDSVSRATSKT